MYIKRNARKLVNESSEGILTQSIKGCSQILGIKDLYHQLDWIEAMVTQVVDVVFHSLGS